MKFWNLKFFISVSLGLHLFFLSIVTFIFPDVKIDPIPPLNIEVSLLPTVRAMIAEEKQLKTSIKKEEEKSPPSPSIQTEVKVIPIINPQPPSQPQPQRLPIENEKLETGIKKEERVVEEPVIQAMSIPIPLEPDLTLRLRPSPTLKSTDEGALRVNPEQDPAFSLERAEGLTRSAAPSPAFESGAEKRRSGSTLSKPQPLGWGAEGLTFHVEKTTDSKGPHLPDVPASEEPKAVVKYSSPSDGNIIFAQPKYAENPKPLYPQEARRKGYEGEVLLRVQVLSDGGVGRIEIKKSSGYEMLDRSALTAVKQWKFIPAKKGENAIPFWVNIPVKFQLQSKNHAP